MITKSRKKTKNKPKKKIIVKPTTLSIAKKYIDSKNLSKDYTSNVLSIAKDCKYLESDCINKYLKTRLDKVTTITAKNNRTILLCLYRFAYENDIINYPIKNILKIKVKKAPVKAWTHDDLKFMLKETEKFSNKKTRSGIGWDVFLKCWILLAYESGARFGDVFHFKRENLDNNILRWTMSKTCDPMTKILSESCLKYINILLDKSDDDTILGYIVKKRQAHRIMRLFIDSCSLEGTSKFLRRSGATHIEQNNPGMAKFHLGHRTNGLAEKHYLDYGQIKRNIPVVPSLFD